MSRTEVREPEHHSPERKRIGSDGSGVFFVVPIVALALWALGALILVWSLS